MVQVNVPGGAVAPGNVTRVFPDQGIYVWAFGVLLSLKLAGHQTGGLFSVFEDELAPGPGPPLHYHTKEDETWYMLDGELTWTVGKEEFVVTKGHWIFHPRGTPHTFANNSGKKASMLIQYTPAGLEEWFMEIGAPVEDVANTGSPPSPAPEVMMKAGKLGAEKYGLVFVEAENLEQPAAKDEL